MDSPFEVIEHIIPGQHLREWPRATGTSQEAVLRIHIKQYRPKDNLDPQPGDVTVIGAYGIGFPKELLGNDHGWLDHARDLLHMTNVFRSEMPRPIVGIGHSFGANILAQLSLMHARLFSALILFDPGINIFSLKETGAMKGVRLSASRRDSWPSREAAVQSFRRSRFFSWDPRVLDAWVKHSIRDMPANRQTPGDTTASNKVTLVTSRHQETFTYFRPLYPYVQADGTVDRDGAPDFDPAMNIPADVRHLFPFYWSEGHMVVERLPHVRPSVLWVFGGSSDITLPPSSRSETVRACGSGSNGSGGVAAGRVAEVVLEGHGHLFPFEIQREMKHYYKAEKEYADWVCLPLYDKTILNEEFMAALGIPAAKKESTNRRRSGKP
ncbi:prolyl aminopeptidase-like protein [Xylaria digitata]|nr:prolyl aminopeptidase-like protein [Xylaria digitata]